MLKHTKAKNQYLVSVVSVSFISLLCLFTRDLVDYKVIGYLLLVVVSLLAIFLEILPVLLAALLAALALDYLFIQPYYTFHIHSAEDALLLLLFFVIALINAVLTYKIRKAEQRIQIKEAKLNTMKLYNTLLDSLSHELRTPIATIIGAVGTMQGKTSQISEDNRAKLLSEMEKAALRLNHQVENLLNMSRLESGYIQPNFDWCDIKELVYNVLNTLSDELTQHKIIVETNDYLPLFKLDYGLMEHVIYNLVYNASQYTPAGATITIDIDFQPEVVSEYKPDEAITLVITIEDDGHGFPEDAIDKVFEKFYRVQFSKTGGTGLGLSIVKGFVEAQKGTVTVENSGAGGARFQLKFPAKVIHTKSINHE